MSILLALAAIPGMLGTQEAIHQGQQKERREEHRARRCNIVATCIKNSPRALEINGRPIVLRDGAIYVDTCNDTGLSNGHRFAGYYLPYPDSPYEGLVTTITDEAPILNWVYIDARNCQLRYGTRKEAQQHFTGPFDCTRQDHRLTFQAWEGFCAVETEPGVWGVFFDIEDDGLQGRVRAGTLQAGSRVLEIELQRVENRHKKNPEARKIDQTINRAQQLDANNREVITEPGASAAKSKTAANSKATPQMDSYSGNAAGVPTLSAPMPSVDTTSYPTVPWPGTTERGASTSKAQSKPSTFQGHPPKARRDSVRQTNSSENYKARQSEDNTDAHTDSSAPQSPTVVHVEPPVILSTHQLRPKRQGRSRPPQASRRYTDELQNSAQTSDAKSNRHENTSPIEFTEPKLVTLTDSHTYGAPLEKPTDSKARSIFKRLGKSVSVSRKGDASMAPPKFKIKGTKGKANRENSVLHGDSDERGGRGRSRRETSRAPTGLEETAKPRDSHQEDNDTSNPAVSRFRRSLSVVRSPSMWGHGK